MLPFITQSKKLSAGETVIFLVNSVNDLPRDIFTTPELNYLSSSLKEKDKDLASINRLGKWLFVYRVGNGKTTPKKLEKFRKAGDGLLATLNGSKIVKIVISDLAARPSEALAMAEGMALGNYRFLKYVRKDVLEKEPSLKTIQIISKSLKSEQVERLNILCDAVYRCRSLVNEPLSSLNAEKLAREFERMGEEAGIKVEVMNKSRIEAMRMGGLLAVNRGSADLPTFTIMEYKPDKAVNKKPLVLVGKGIVYDTGGLNLKPSAAMDGMKSDMAGAATAATVVYAIALAKLPVHVVALAPATDNRPDGNAITPGDIITMMDGTTVEVLNTDAEGRLILADALSYAKNFDPMLVIDVATLTGAAMVTLGMIGIAGMHAGAGKFFNMLCESGVETHERIAELPLWDEYADLLKSEIADLKNIGGRYAGTITAAKFLQHFTGYPWIHLDIAGPSFLEKKDAYRTAGGTASGVRLLFEFASRLAESKQR
ncbi:MAG TPA: leucyl aminopeptidase [Bacteroidales bacterium]|nr:leucyl aminopeptidase [Bacteroidales bacterium]